MVLTAISTSWSGAAIGRYVVELLTSGTLRWDSSTLIRFDRYFDIARSFSWEILRL
jgi:hypothetical protein